MKDRPTSKPPGVARRRFLLGGLAAGAGAGALLPGAPLPGRNLPGATNTYARLNRVNTFTADNLFRSGRPWVDVRAHGAKGDGIADDTAAIQASVDALPGGGTVFLPMGTYKVAGNLAIASNYVSLVGASRGATVISHAGSGVLLDVTGSYGTVDRVGFWANPLGGTTSLVRLKANQMCRLSHVQMWGRNVSGTVGLDLAALASPDFCGYHTFEDVYVYQCDVGMKLHDDWGASAGVWGVNANTFLNCRVSTTTGGPGVEIDRASGNLFLGGSVENYPGYGFSIAAGRRTQVMGTWIEGGAGADGPVTLAPEAMPDDQWGIVWMPVNASGGQSDLANMGRQSWYVDRGDFANPYEVKGQMAARPDAASTHPLVVKNLQGSEVSYFTSGGALVLGAGTANAAGGGQMTNTGLALYPPSTSGKGLVIKLPAGAAADAVQIQDSSGAVLASVDRNGVVRGPSGLATKTKAGAVGDADFAGPPPDGTLALDTSANRLYVRVGGVWRSVGLA